MLRSYLVGPFAFLGCVVLSVVAPIVALLLYLIIPLGYLFEGPVGQIDEGYLGEED